MTKHKTEDYKISAVKYYLNNDKDIEDFFIYQRVNNPNEPTKILISIWKLHFHALTEFNDFWLDEKRP